MKAFIFVLFSVLIHCCIFKFALTSNGQDSPIARPFLRKIKTPVAALKASEDKYPKIPPTLNEPKLFAPKKLSALAVSRLSYHDGLVYLLQSNSIHPEAAHHHTGTVILSVEVNSVGRLTDLQIREPSNHQILNQAALKSAAEIEFYKPLPLVLRPVATILVPIHFF